MAKYAGRGIVVSFEGSPLGNLTSFGEVGSNRDLIDASAYGDDWKDFVLGQQDGVEVTGTCAYDPSVSGQSALIVAFDTDPDAVTTWTLAHADAGVTLSFSARIMQLTRGGELGGLFQLSFTLKIVNPGVSGGS